MEIFRPISFCHATCERKEGKKTVEESETSFCPLDFAEKTSWFDAVLPVEVGTPEPLNASTPQPHSTFLVRLPLEIHAVHSPQ